MSIATTRGDGGATGLAGGIRVLQSVAPATRRADLDRLFKKFIHETDHGVRAVLHFGMIVIADSTT